MTRPPARQLTLPGGYVIRLVYRTTKQLKPGDRDCFGFWQAGHNGGKIVINRDYPQWRQLKTFGHELIHAINDYVHWIDFDAEALRKEVEETAKAMEEE